MKKLLLLHLLLAMFLGVQTIKADVVLNATNFPDDNFRTYISNLTGVRVGSTISDAKLASVNKISAIDKDISSMQGIEYFTKLSYLSCAQNQLTTLDLSKNTELTQLVCNSNKLTSLDVSKNTLLFFLNCNQNQLTSLDVKLNSELSTLRCSSNKLTSLDVSENAKLTALECNRNKISYLFLRNNTELKYFYCSSNKIDQLDLSNNTMLILLQCDDNCLTHLELDNTALTDRTAVDVGNQSSTRRFTVNSYGSNTNNCWGLYVGTTDDSRIRNLKIDGTSKTPKVTASGWLVVSDDLKKIPQKVEYEIYTGNEAAGWMPVTVNYDVKRYGVYVAGTELTSLNFYDIPGLKEGTAYFYDESSGLGWSGIYPTLVLYDAKIEGEKGLYNKECYDLKIIARGNNSITATDWTGFDTDPVVKTTISGGGKLWITATGDRNGGIYNSDASTLKITDGTKVISQGDGYGFFDDGGTLYIQDNSILACYGNESASVELPTESNCKFDSNIGIRYPAGAYIGNSYHVFYAGTTTDVQRDWVVIGPDNQATQDFIATGIESIHNSQFTVHNEEAIYNLAGQRLSKTQRGINIVGGKKIIRK